LAKTPFFSGSLSQYKKVNKEGVIVDDTIVDAKQVALAVKLQTIVTKDEPARDFLMMTAHVKSGDSPKDVPVKIHQGKQVAGIIVEHNKKQMPVIFACDFNNKPGGDAHNAFTGELKAKDTTVKSAYENVLQEWRCTEEIKHGRLSKIERVEGDCPKCKKLLTQEPKFTTDKWRKGGTQKDKRGKTKQTIDYIFYTEEFECSRVLNITKEKIEPVHMPGWKYPSDHFCIAADLTFSRQRRRRMAQREFSSRRDSPVMVRLLQQIIDAQDD